MPGLTSYSHSWNENGLWNYTIPDPCLFFKKKESDLVGLIGTLDDDTLDTGSEELALEEESKSSKFDVKPREEDFPLMVGGSRISKISAGYLFSHQDDSMTLAKISSNNFTSESNAHLRRQLAYVATSTCPDIAYIDAKLAQVSCGKATAVDLRLLNTSAKVLKDNDRGLPFPKLDNESLVIRSYADASFTTNSDHS